MFNHQLTKKAESLSPSIFLLYDPTKPPMIGAKTKACWRALDRVRFASRSQHTGLFSPY